MFERYRKCGKPGCHCAAEGDPGHGPNRVLTARVDGKPLTRAQIAECKRLRALTAELIEVSEGLCQSRLSTRGAGTVKKGALPKTSPGRSSRKRRR